MTIAEYLTSKTNLVGATALENILLEATMSGVSDGVTIVPIEFSEEEIVEVVFSDSEDIKIDIAEEEIVAIDLED